MPSKYIKKGNRNFDKVCVVCGKDFKGTHGQLACSEECIQIKTGYPTRAEGLDSAKVGAIGELRVAADLLEKGYEVYRSVSATSSADLIAHKEGKTTRVEVKTGQRMLVGDSCACAISRFRADVLAIIVPDRILYFSRETVDKSNGSFLFTDGINGAF